MLNGGLILQLKYTQRNFYKSDLFAVPENKNAILFHLEIMFSHSHKGLICYLCLRKQNPARLLLTHTHIQKTRIRLRQCYSNEKRNCPHFT